MSFVLMLAQDISFNSFRPRLAKPLLSGPQAMLGWAVAILIAIPDGMIWSELGAALPGSGGTYRYLREGFGRETWGRLMAFLFIWMFILSGPLEIASGYIGFGAGPSFQSGDTEARGGRLFSLGKDHATMALRRRARPGARKVNAPVTFS